jgi:hypothetical protein
MSDVGYHRH